MPSAPAQYRRIADELAAQIKSDELEPGRSCPVRVNSQTSTASASRPRTVPSRSYMIETWSWDSRDARCT